MAGVEIRRVLVRSESLVILTAAHRIVRLSPSADEPSHWTAAVYDPFVQIVDIFVDDACRHLCFTSSEHSLYYLPLYAVQTSPSLLTSVKQPISALVFQQIEPGRILLFIGTVFGSVLSLHLSPPSTIQQSNLYTIDGFAPIGSMTLWTEDAESTLFVLVYSSPMRVHVLNLNPLFDPQLVSGKLAGSSVPLPGHAAHGSSVVLARIDEEFIIYAVVMEEGLASGIIRGDSLRNRCRLHPSDNQRTSPELPLGPPRNKCWLIPVSQRISR